MRLSSAKNRIKEIMNFYKQANGKWREWIDDDEEKADFTPAHSHTNHILIGIIDTHTQSHNAMQAMQCDEDDEERRQRVMRRKENTMKH